MLDDLPHLESALGPDSAILTDTNSADFKEHLKRWTDIDKETPRAIVLPASERDIQKASGGHSEWSTIGNEGVVIDLSRYKRVEVNKDSQTAVIRGSILSKEVAVALAEAGLFTALGNGNTVEAIPYFLGGRASITTSITGFGSDQILSARMISAKGDLLDVTEQSHPDLLYAIRGAGQYFGLITELKIRAHPLEKLGNDRGVIWAGSFVFPLDRAAEVCSVMETLVNDSAHATAGLMMVMAPPPTRKPSLVIAARYTGDPEHAVIAYKPLYGLQPLVAAGGEVPIQNSSDARAAIGAKGDFKRFGVVGLHQFKTEPFLRTVELWKQMISECPDAINTAYNFQWDARPPKQPDFESANCLHDIRFWQNNLIWHTDEKNRAKVDEYNSKSIAVMRDLDDKKFVDFVKGTRVEPIKRRYRGSERLQLLKSLKAQWDPTGLFTKQLL